MLVQGRRDIWTHIASCCTEALWIKKHVKCDMNLSSNHSLLMTACDDVRIVSSPNGLTPPAMFFATRSFAVAAFGNLPQFPRFCDRQTVLLLLRIPRSTHTVVPSQNLSNTQVPSTQYLKTLVPKTIQCMVFGTRDLKYWTSRDPPGK